MGATLSVELLLAQERLVRETQAEFHADYEVVCLGAISVLLVRLFSLASSCMVPGAWRTCSLSYGKSVGMSPAFSWCGDPAE
jgi:hypothetical protein